MTLKNNNVSVGLVRLRQRQWFNVFVGLFKLSNGQVFGENCLLPYRYVYKKDFFRNTLWENIDEPAPIETILQFIRRYGQIPRSLLVRIYFYEAKKRRRSYRSIEKAMNRRIRLIQRQYFDQDARIATTASTTDLLSNLLGVFGQKL